MSNSESKTYDFEGSTIEDAIKKAVEELNINRDQMEVKIICEEKKGLFGMEGEKPARIKVTLKS